MKELVQRDGIRKWFGDDWITIQNECKTVVEALAAGFDTQWIVSGCEVDGSTVAEGVVVLYSQTNGYKYCRFAGATNVQFPVYFDMHEETATRLYVDSQDKPVSIEYTAELTSDAGSGRLQLMQDGSTARLRDALQDNDHKLMTQTERTKLSNIETNATADQTGEEIKVLLEALSGASRLLASAIAETNDVKLLTASERTKLAGIEINATGDQSGAEIKALLEALSGTARLSANAIKDLPTNEGGTMTGAEIKAALETLSGASRLLASAIAETSDVKLMTASERTKLSGIENNATGDQTGAEIKALLEALSGTSRLSANAIKDLPTNEGGTMTGAEIKAALETLSGTGRLLASAIAETSDVKLLTAAERTKLSGIEANATGDQTGAEIKTLLEALSGTSRLLASAIAETSDVKLLTAAERTKLSGIEANATGDQTGAEIKTLLEALSGTSRLLASAIAETSDEKLMTAAERNKLALLDVLQGGVRLGDGASALSNGVAVGYDAEAGQNAVALGSGSQATSFGGAAIGTGAYSDVGDQMVLGTSVSTIKTGAGVAITSDSRDKADIADNELGLDFVRALRTRKWHSNNRDLYFTGEKDEDGLPVIDEAAHAEGREKGSRWHRGIVTQEVAAMLTELGLTGTDFSAIKDTTINNTHKHIPTQSFDYTQLFAPLIKAIQELATRVDALER